MKLRILRKKVYVSSSAQKGWKASKITHEKDVLQTWDDKNGWIDIPVVIDSHEIYGDTMELTSY